MPLCTLMRRVDCWFIYVCERSCFSSGFPWKNWNLDITIWVAVKPGSFSPQRPWTVLQFEFPLTANTKTLLHCPWYGSSVSVFGTALASVLSLEMSLVPSTCWSYNPQDFFLWPAIHSVVLKSSRREQQGHRRDCGFFSYRLVLLIYPLHVFKLFSPSNAPNNQTPAAGAPRLAYLWQGPAPDGWPFGC